MSLKVWLPEGKTEDHRVTVSGKRTTIYAHPIKWFSAEVTNEGPDEVRVMLNAQSPTKAKRLAQDESRTFEFDKPVISNIDLENDVGKTSEVVVTVMW